MLVYRYSRGEASKEGPWRDGPQNRHIAVRESACSEFQKSAICIY